MAEAGRGPLRRLEDQVVEGIGLGLRRAFAAKLLRAGATSASPINWLEVTPENWVFFGGKSRRLLDEAAEQFAIVPHAVSLSIGGPDPLDDTFLDAVARLCERVQPPWWSDHLCYSSVAGAPVHDLLPLPFTDEAVAHVAARVREVQARVPAPLALENATYYAHMPGCTMDEAAFLTAVVEQSGCALLLDVNNVYVNSVNHGFDARAFIDRMPLSRVVQLHVAGHTRIGDTIIDTHIGPVIDPVWELYRYTLQRARRLIPTLVEWDQDIPELPEVLAEVDRARAHAAQALGDAAARGSQKPSGAQVAP